MPLLPPCLAPLAAAGLPVSHSVALLGTSLHSGALALFLAASHAHGHLFHLLLSFGLVGFFLVAVVDSSFVPLPIPGISDLMIIFFAAQHTNLILLVGLATVGSALGGYVSFVIGQRGGLHFLEQHVSKRLLVPVQGWMEHHAILSVSLPAILPPPMPLSPFVLVAGVTGMSLRRFMTAFTLSRLLRHVAAAWVGVHYGKQVLSLWNRFSDRWATTILAVIWTVILVGVAVAGWRLYKISKKVDGSGKGDDAAKGPSLPSPAATS